MPNTKWESIVFTAVMAWGMVYGMTVYNTVLTSGVFVNATFLTALKGMWVEYGIIFLCAYFISGRVAHFLAFRVVKPGDRGIFIIWAMQLFTVISQVALASILGVYHRYGFTAQLIPNYIVVYCQNFVMALPLQLFIVGPLMRNGLGRAFRWIEERGKRR